MKSAWPKKEAENRSEKDWCEYVRSMVDKDGWPSHAMRLGAVLGSLSRLDCEIRDDRAFRVAVRALVVGFDRAHSEEHDEKYGGDA